MGRSTRRFRLLSISHSNKDIRIYSAYQCVNADIDHIGPNTYYTQLWRLLRDKVNRYPQPWRGFIKDLHEELTTTKRNNLSLIVVGDFNESIGTDPALMASICSSIRMSDAVEHSHPQSDTIPTTSICAKFSGRPLPSSVPTYEILTATLRRPRHLLNASPNTRPSSDTLIPARPLTSWPTRLTIKSHGVCFRRRSA
jgi:hypothetical protein